MAEAMGSKDPTTLAGQLRARLERLCAAHDLREVVQPVALLMVLAEEEGGDETADELIRRMDILDRESGNLIDFYYLGWSGRAKSKTFDLDSFVSFRSVLGECGVTTWGGNADLILVDARRTLDGSCSLDFSRAVHLDLSKSISRGDIDTLGSLVQTLVEASQEIRERAHPVDSPVYQISDRLGVIFSRESLVDFVLSKLGNWFGAKKLRAVATKSLGPELSLAQFRAKEVRDAEEQLRLTRQRRRRLLAELDARGLLKPAPDHPPSAPAQDDQS